MLKVPIPVMHFFTPAGRVHAIGAGIVLVEIQQTSDITYRIFDWKERTQVKKKESCILIWPSMQSIFDKPARIR